MFRVYNPSNLDQFIEVQSYPQALDITRYTWELPLTDRNLRPSEFFKWMEHTITDTTWDEHLHYRVMRTTGCQLDDVPLTAEYKALKALFENRPKWLSEFVYIAWEGSNRFYLRYCLPNHDGTGLDYYNTFTSGRISCQQTTDFSTPYPTQNLTLDVTQDTIAVFFTTLRENMTRYLDTGGSRNRTKNYDALLASQTFTMPLRMLFRTLLNVQTFKHTDRRGRNSNVLPSDVRRIMTENPEATLSINVSGGSDWVIVCREPRTPAKRNELAEIFPYSTNVLDLLPFNIRSRTEAKAPLYGIELEACSNYTPKQIIDAQAELFFICKQDGSISGTGQYKYELVTVPATFKAHKRMWADWFSKLDYTKFDTSKDTGNGMHVHIDRRAFFDTKHLNRFTWFITNPANLDFMFEISERVSKSELERWAPMPRYPSSKSKIYAMRNATSICRSLRGSVHFKNNNKTIEVRLFKGVVSYATILKNLEFVDSVFNYTGDTSLQQISLGNYLKWLSSQPVNRYTALREFIAQLKTMDNIMFSNQIKEYLFNISHPDTILEKLNKAPFKITNKHITAINRERRKRTFILNKNGTVSLAYSTGGKLASLDKVYQSKMIRGAQPLTTFAMAS